MGPLEQRIRNEHVERQHRFFPELPPVPKPKRGKRRAWHTPQVLSVVEPNDPIDLALYRLIHEAASIEDAVGLPPAKLPPRMSCKLIQTIVGKFYRFTRNDLLSPRRDAETVHARHVAVWLACRLTRLSLPRIGQQFGGRDHTTILHARRSIEAQRQTDARLADELQLLAMRLREATGWREDEAS